MKALALTLAAIVGLTVAGSGTAEAQGWNNRGGYGFGYGGWGHGSYRQPYYGHTHHNVNPYTAGYRGGHLHWHDTTHYDYVPPRMIRHGNHYHLRPGGYRLHVDGHWDLHHH